MNDKAKDAENKQADAPDVSQLESKLKNFESQIATFNTKIQTLESELSAKDKTIEKLKKAKGERDSMVDDKVKEGDEAAFQKRMDDIRAEAAEREEALKKQLESTNQRLHQEMVVNKANAIAADLFNADQLPFIQMVVERHCKLNDGIIEVYDDKGQVRYSEENRKEKMGLSEFMKELVSKHPSSAKPTARSGGDTGEQKTGSSGNSGKGYTPHELMKAPPTEQARMIQEGDVDSARGFLRAISGSGKR